MDKPSREIIIDFGYGKTIMGHAIHYGFGVSKGTNIVENFGITNDYNITISFQIATKNGYLYNKFSSCYYTWGKRDEKYKKEK